MQRGVVGAHLRPSRIIAVCYVVSKEGKVLRVALDAKGLGNLPDTADARADSIWFVSSDAASLSSTPSAASSRYSRRLSREM